MTRQGFYNSYSSSEQTKEVSWKFWLVLVKDQADAVGICTTHG